MGPWVLINARWYETLKQISKVGRMKRFGKYCDFVRTSKFNGGADLAHQIITQTIEAFEFVLRRRRRGLQVRHGFTQAMLRREFVRRQQQMRSC